MSGCEGGVSRAAVVSVMVGQGGGLREVRGRLTGDCSTELEIDADVAAVGSHYCGVFLHLLGRVVVFFSFVPGDRVG